MNPELTATWRDVEDIERRLKDIKTALTEEINRPRTDYDKCHVRIPPSSTASRLLSRYYDLNSRTSSAFSKIYGKMLGRDR